MLITETAAQVRAFWTVPPPLIVLPIMSFELVLFASTKMMLAPGRDDVAHSTSRASSPAHRGFVVG